MLAPTPQPAPRLWTTNGFREDSWKRADATEALDGTGWFILPLAVFLDLDPQTRRANAGRIGVALAPGDMLERIVAHLDEIALVALEFPAFSDGRSFSKAELLRSRHGFTRPIRATGQVLVDQLPHMIRVGFDEFEVVHPVLLDRLDRGETGGIGYHYQPTAGAGRVAGGYSWRRVSS